jgi:sugar/nucleoside kinase (ribokinase family)
MAEVWIMGEMIVEIMRPVVDVSLEDPELFKGPYPSGAPAIFIDTVARLGHSAAIIGGVGKDEFGKCLLKRLENDGVDCSKVIESDKFATGVAFVTYFSDGSRKFIFHMGNTPAVEPKAPAPEDLAGVKFFHIMGCSLMANAEFAKEIVKTMHLARERGAKISFDPNIRKELLRDSSVFMIVSEVFENTNVFMPGLEELLLITGETNVEAAIKKCFENPKIEIIVLKNGSKGSSVYTRTEEFKMGIYPAEVVDSTGAGDSFDGAFICGLLENKDIKTATQMGTAAATLNVAAFGPMEGKISPAAIHQMIQDNR